MKKTKRTAINAEAAPSSAHANYAQAVRVTGVSDLLIISGQVPIDRDGAMPEGIRAQSDQVWRNIDSQLVAAGFSKENIIKITTYLARREDMLECRASRVAYLDGVEAASTLIICGIADETWPLEIEVMAAR
ncbi:MAG: RidA family protein [Pseudomonadota bacterium]